MNSKRLLGWSAFFAVALLLAGLAHWFAEPQDDPDAADAVTVAIGKAQVRGDSPTARAAKAPAPIKDLTPAGDLFSARNWKPAAVLASVTEKPLVQTPVVQAPTVPPLPFQFIGRLDDRRDLQVFLQSGEKIYVVRKGDVIDDIWRIEGISDKELNLVYLPMHLSQTLSVGSAP